MRGTLGANKFHNHKVTIDNIVFDSKREANRYGELKTLEKSGIIKNLELQKKFELVPTQYEEVDTGEVYARGEKKGLPKMKKVCREKAVDYIADFVYERDGKTIVEDVKGMRTKDYIIKRKLMLWVHGVEVAEI